MISKFERRQFVVHGPAVRLEIGCEAMRAEIDRALRPFAVAGFPPNAVPINGTISDFDLPDVSRHLSSRAVAVGGMDGLIELYSDEERYWVVDERWGICEIDLLKQRWRSWLLPKPALDPVRCVDASVIWPMSQLLRSRGIELLPSISIERNGWAALIIAPYGISSELSRLVRAGYRVIGQRWTAMRTRGQHVALMHFPGAIEAPVNPKPMGSRFSGEPTWLDLTASNPWAAAQSGLCKAVFVIEPGRRLVTRGRLIPPSSAANLLRYAWPIVQLPLNRRRVDATAVKIAEQCPCVCVHLSRSNDDFLQLIECTRRRCTTDAATKKPPIMLRRDALTTALRSPENSRKRAG